MKREPVTRGPDRPTHFNEDQNVRVSRDETELDYPVGTDAALEQQLPYGWAPPITPAPVYLTEPPPKDRRMIRATAMHVVVTDTTTKVPLVSANRNRTRLKIVNSDDTTSVALVFGELDNINVAAFWLGPGDDVEMYHTSAMWAQLSGGDGAATIEVYTEYEVDEL